MEFRKRIVPLRESKCIPEEGLPVREYILRSLCVAGDTSYWVESGTVGILRRVER